MAPRKPTKDEIASLLASGMPESSMPAMEPLRAADVVTYPALGAILAAPLERIESMKELMLEKFSSLEKLSLERQNQMQELKKAVDKEKANAVKFKIASLVAIVGFLAELVIRLAIKS